MTPAELAEEYRNLVYVTARETWRRHPWDDREELVSDGMVGLMQAAERYDGTGGVPFAGFAGPRIKGAMIDGLRSRRPGWRQGRPVGFDVLEQQSDPRFSPSPEQQVLDRLALARVLERVADLPDSLQSTARVLMAGGVFKALADAEGVTDGAISHRLAEIRRRLAA